MDTLLIIFIVYQTIAFSSLYVLAKRIVDKNIPNMVKFVCTISPIICIFIIMLINISDVITNDLLYIVFLHIASVILFNIFVVIADKLIKQKPKAKVYGTRKEIMDKVINDYNSNSVELNSSYFDFDVEMPTKDLLDIYIDLVCTISGDDIVRLQDVKIDDNHNISGKLVEKTIPDDYHNMYYRGNYADFLQKARNDNRLNDLYRIINMQIDGYEVEGYNADFIL